MLDRNARLNSFWSLEYTSGVFAAFIGKILQAVNCGNAVNLGPSSCGRLYCASELVPVKPVGKKDLRVKLQCGAHISEIYKLNMNSDNHLY